jgi:hypothetical protein
MNIIWEIVLGKINNNTNTLEYTWHKQHVCKASIDMLTLASQVTDLLTLTGLWTFFGMVWNLVSQTC